MTSFPLKLVTMGGTHFNFLMKSLSVAIGYQQPFDPYNNSIGAHSDGQKKVNGKLINVKIHEYFWKETDELIDSDIMIMLDTDRDLYRFYHHLFWAGEDIGFDFLLLTEENAVSKIEEEKALFMEKESTIGFEVALRIFQNIIEWEKYYEKNSNGVRDMIVNQFLSGKEGIKRQRKFIEDNNIPILIRFDDFYQKDKFFNALSMIIEYLGLKWTNDVSSMYDAFIVRKQRIIESLYRVEDVFNKIKERSDGPINLNLYEQGYLDYVVKNYFNTDIDIHYKKYPKSVLEYISRNNLLLAYK